MNILKQLYWFIDSAVIAVIVTVIVLILLRVIANQADLNPFGWSARTIRRLTDPLIMPVRRHSWALVWIPSTRRSSLS